MAAQDIQNPTQTNVERNTNRIDRLIHEVEMLVELLEEQRLVEPTALAPLKRQLREIHQRP